ncbi:MAG: hypothetical protein J6Y16_07780 [Treponema sp.]|nr:hypothetical protein [Treponema sp.]
MVLAIVVSAALAAVISIVISQVTKSQNAMDKVKKYADRRQAEFDEYFKTEKDNIQLLRSELESKDAQAKAAVKRLDQQKAEFDKLVSSLQDPIDQVNYITEKVDSYDEVLHNLMEMTTAVEENLQKVKDEAHVIDVFNGRLNDQNKKVASIDRQIGALVHKFTESNQNGLKHLGDSLLEEYESRAQSIADSTQHAIEESRVIMNKIAADIKDTYDNAAERANRLEDAAFEELQKKSDERSASLMEELGIQTKQLQALIDSRIQNAQESIKVQTENYKESLDGPKKAFEKEYYQRMSEISADI